jgi:protein tyrosine kinase
VGAGEPRPRLGDYILVARLSEDALGSVYRAIHVRDGRFARLRLLESLELPRAALLTAIQKKDAPHRMRSFYPPGRRETLGVAEGRPFLAWHETSGWTLDVVLAGLRKTGTRIPTEGALKIVLGAAVALEHARATIVDGEPTRHGLLWPGFVTISRNAEVWVRGFGLAPGVLPALEKARLSRLLAPYLAPEARKPGPADERADVYSLGVLLLELLSGEPPSLYGPPEFTADDPFSQDAVELARLAVVRYSERLPSVAAMREHLQKLLEDCPYEKSNADLVLFLDDLLAPEKGARGARPRPSAVPAGLATSPRKDVEPPGASRRVWALRIAASIVAVATLAGIDLTVRRRGPDRTIAAPAARVLPSRAVVPAPPIPTDQLTLPEEEQEQLPVLFADASLAVPKPPASVRSSLSARRQASELAEVWRLRAALSRVSAQRLDALNLASEPFRLGRVHEKEGERLLARRKFAAAHEAFERAAELYLEAEALSHEERARVIRLSTLDERASASRKF